MNKKFVYQDGNNKKSCVTYVFVSVRSIIICRQYLADQARVTPRLTVSLSDLVSRVLAGPPSPGGTKKFFHRGPNPLSAALFMIFHSPKEITHHQALVYNEAVTSID
jgi:hypothetical protein